MARYITIKDHKLAQKYKLGTPTRKYHFDAASIRPLQTFWKFFLLLWLTIIGLGSIDLGLTTLLSANDIQGVWFWLLLALIIPVTTSIVLMLFGKKRPALLNAIATFLSFFCVTVFRGSFLAHPPYTDPLAAFLAGCFSVLAGLLLLWAVGKSLMFARTLLVCMEGCLTITWLQRIHVVRWEQIREIWSGQFHTKIIADDGTRLTIYHRWPNAKTVRDLISSRTFRHIRAQAMEQYNQGEQVPFGTFRLHQQGISKGATLFRWNDIRECEYMDDGIALIGVDDTCLAMAPLSSLPNAAVFVALVNSILAARLAVVR